MATTAELQILIRARDQASKTLKNVSQNAGQAGRSLVALSAPIIGLGVIGVKTFADFEAAIARTGAVSGATETQLTQLEQAARQMGRTTAFTASQSAEALSFMAMAGMDVDNAIGALPRVLELAAAGSFDLGQAADIVTNVMAGMQLKTEDLSHANDVLVTAFTSANTDLTQLGQAFKFAGPVASAAGISFEETAAALALMGNAGIQASMAGTGLRGSITKLLNPTKEAQQVIDQLGATVKDSTDNLLPLRDLVGEFERVGLSAGDAMTIFGQRAGPAMLALVSQGSAALETLVSRMQDSGGTAERIATAQLDTFSGQMAIMKSAIQDVLIELGKGLVPILRDVFVAIQPLLNSMGKFIEKHPTLTKVAVAAAAAIAALGIALVGLSIILPGLIAMAPIVGGAMTLMFGPVGVAVVAVGLLGAAFATNFLGIRDTIMSVWRVVKGIYESWLGWFLPAGPLIKGLIALKDNWDTVWGAIKATIDAFIDTFMTSANFIIKGLRLFGADIEYLTRGVDTLSESAREAKRALDPMMDRAVIASVEDAAEAAGDLAKSLDPGLAHSCSAGQDALTGLSGAADRAGDSLRALDGYITDVSDAYAVSNTRVQDWIDQVTRDQVAALAEDIRLHRELAAAVNEANGMFGPASLQQQHYASVVREVNDALSAETLELAASMVAARELEAAAIAQNEAFARSVEGIHEYASGLRDMQHAADAVKGSIDQLNESLIPTPPGGVPGSGVPGAQTPAERLLNLLGGIPIGGMETIYRALGITSFDKGGTVPGPLGQPRVIMAHGGEVVTPAGQAGGVTNNFYGPVYGIDDLDEHIAQTIKDRRRRGGFDGVL